MSLDLPAVRVLLQENRKPKEVERTQQLRTYAVFFDENRGMTAGIPVRTGMLKQKERKR